MTRGLKDHTKGPEPRDIYEYAYAQGRKVIGPRRHWRHAIDFTQVGGSQSLEQDFSHHSRKGGVASVRGSSGRKEDLYDADS